MRQYNLSITNTYQIIDSYYTGEGNGNICDNCGRYITNCATVKSDKGECFCVGMDCAETLSGINGDFDFEYIHKANFNLAQKAYTKIKSLIKKASEKQFEYSLEYELYHTRNNGEVVSGIIFQTVPFNVYMQYWIFVKPEIFEKYIFPMVKKFEGIKERKVEVA